MRAISRVVSLSRPQRLFAVGASAAAAAGVFLSSSSAAPAKGPAASYVYAVAKTEKKVEPTNTIPPMKPRVVFVLGGPGAGKGTQSALLVQEYGYVHLSAGDLLREEQSSGSEVGTLIKTYIDEGKIVPVEVTVRLLTAAMKKSGGSKFLIDGFPRNADNVKGWENVAGPDTEVCGVLFYDCPEHVMESRLTERGKTSGRSDDKAEVIRKRFHTYVEATMPVIKKFEGEGKVFHVIADSTVDRVFASTRRVLEPVVKQEVIDTTKHLLDAIHAGDWNTYAAMCAPAITCVEPESNEEVVKGHGFHKYYFDEAAAAGGAGEASQSTIVNPQVHMLSGKAAVIAYTRLVQRGGKTTSYGETRVWQFEEGAWKNLHFHRSAGGATA